MTPAVSRVIARSGCAEMKLAGNRMQHFVEVAPGAAGHRPPHRPRAITMQEPMIVEEGNQRRGGILQHARPRCGPHCGGHRDQVVLAKSFGEIAPPKIFSDGAVSDPSRIAIRHTDAVEPKDLAKHPEKAGREEVSFLGKNGAQVLSAPFHAAAVKRKGKAHIACVGFHAQMGEKLDQFRIVAFVVDDEAGIDGDMRAIIIDVDCCGVPAGAMGCFEERHIGDVAQRPRCGSSGYARPDDCNTPATAITAERNDPHGSPSIVCTPRGPGRGLLDAQPKERDSARQVSRRLL